MSTKLILIVLTIAAIGGASVVVDDLQSDSKATTTTTAMTTTSAGASMSGMPAGDSSSKSPAGIMTVNGATLPVMSAAMPMAMAITPLGKADWDGMKIVAQTAAPATFILLNEGSQQLVRPNAKTSFHLMVQLSDEFTGDAIPYSSVWATVRKASKIVFDERLWPMISRYMGPHYGNNIALPTAGLYHLSLLVSPPEAARHLEYKNLWLKPHKVSFTFRWVPKT